MADNKKLTDSREPTAEEIVEALKANIKYHGNASSLQRMEGRHQDAWKHDTILRELKRVLRGEKLKFRL